METSKLTEYLSVCIDLEKSKFVQANTYNSLNNRLASYKNEYKNNCELLEDNSKTTSIQEIMLRNPDIEKPGCLHYFSIYYVGALGSFLGVLVYNLTHSLGAGFVVGVIGAIVGGSIPVFLRKASNDKKIADSNRKADEVRDRELVAGQQRRFNCQERNKQLSVIIPKIEAEMKNIAETYRLTTQTLNKAYSKNIIPEKYRSIVPICMFYDYLINGRTYSLKRNPSGFDQGAINMYEDECFRQLIINKLDVIIDRLDAISSNQRILYNAIQEGNQKTHQLLNDINSNITNVNGNLKTIQYQNEEQLKCLKYSNYLQTLAYYDSYI